MNERFACWVIVAGSVPTGFRSRDREELLPTFRQLQRTQPDVVLKFFARGKLWDSDTEARDALLASRRAKRPHTKDWRPGGSHVDPRARFELSRDQKRARYKRRLWQKDSGSGPRRDSRSRSDDRKAGPGSGGRPTGARLPYKKKS